MRINPKTAYAQLVEALTFHHDANQHRLFLDKAQSQAMPLARALLDGQTAILYGELSPQLYQQLHSLWGPNPYLIINESYCPVPDNARLVLCTTPALYPTPLADFNQIQQRIGDAELWEAYRGAIPAQDHPVLARLQQWHRCLAQWPHVTSDLPPKPARHFQRLIAMIEAIKQPQFRQNPIKALGLYDYPKGASAYAFINVLAKILFGPDEKHPPRRSKLEKASCVWQQLNALSAADLRDFFEIDLNAKEPLEPPFWSRPNPQHPPQLRPALAQKWQQTRAQYRRASQENMDERPLRGYEKQAQRVRYYLASQPFVQILGPAGSGKTFMANEYHGEKFWGEAQIESWFACQPSAQQPAILILDEANLNRSREGDWLFLSGLRHPTPQVTYRGETYPLSPHHKVLFTGNPVSYSADRSHDPFLQTVPTVYLPGWKEEDLIQKILLPVLGKALKPLPSQEDLDALAKGLCQAYRSTQALLPEGLCSLRDLLQVSQRLLRRAKLSPGTDLFHIAFAACYDEWAGHFGQAHQKQQRRLLHLREAFGCGVIPEHPGCHFDGLYLVPRMAHVLSLMKETYALATEVEHSQANDRVTLLNARQGVLLEGPPGIGKSALARAFARSVLPSDSEPDRIRQITVSQTAHLETTLREAFDQGQIVILDELNLSSTLEKLLNHLLSGHTPEGQPAQRPGFFVIASQNGAALTGRHTVSLALLNRFHCFNLSDFTLEELIQTESTLTGNHRHQIAEHFYLARQQNPKLTMRDFYRVLEPLRQDRRTLPTQSLPRLSFLNEAASRQPSQPELVHTEASTNVKTVRLE